jgi:signal transduction histidine kinase
VAEVRGTVDIESSPGRGTRVVARLPVDEQGDEP